jgi:ABC-type transport system involved in multi-copper enzyme maturation permease subunit
MGNDPLRNGLSLADAAVLGAVAAVFLVASVVLFERRDLAV